MIKPAKLEMLQMYDRSDLQEMTLTSFYCDDLDEVLTIKEYFRRLLETLLTEEEGFSGKRPFGNSGWKHDIYKCLIENGYISGKVDEYGYIEELHHDDEVVADRLLVLMARSI